MGISIITILIAVVLGIVVFFLIRILSKSHLPKNKKLSFKERYFLESNLEIELNKDVLSNRYIRAENREKRNDFKGEIEDIDVILKHEKENFGLVFKRGLNKFRISDFKGAINDFSEVINNTPQDKYSYYYRGLANLKLSKALKAFEDLTKAV